MVRAIFLLFFTFSLFGAPLHNYTTALQKAKLQHKMVYVLVTSTHCRWCKKFKNETLQNKEVVKKLQKRFVTVELTKGFDTIPKQFSSHFMPSHFFVDANGVQLLEDIGYKTPQEFLEILEDLKE